MSRSKKGKTPFEIYYSKIVSEPAVNNCPYHKPFTAAYLYILFAFYCFLDGDSKRCDDNANEVFKFMENNKFTAEEMDVFNESIGLFTKIICKEIAPRGDWFIYDCPNDDVLQRLYLCFGDLICNPDCLNDYANAPIVCGEFVDQVVFAVEFDEIFCLTVEYANSL